MLFRSPPSAIIQRARAAVLKHRHETELVSLDLLASEFGCHVRTLRAAARVGNLRVHFSSRSAFGRSIRYATRADVRSVLHARYQRVLLDEFQDTDPIQLEIAVRLTALPDDPVHETDWRQLRPHPQRLFIVGDPKQSIYRFRRADIAQYLRAAEQTGAETAQIGRAHV